MDLSNLTREQCWEFSKLAGEAATHSMLMINHWRERFEEGAGDDGVLQVCQQRMAHWEQTQGSPRGSRGRAR